MIQDAAIPVAVDKRQRPVGYVRCRRVLYRSRVFGSGTAEVGVYADELLLIRLPYWPTGWSELSVRSRFWYNTFQPDIADILP